MKWLGKAAVLWAMDEAENVPPHLFGALVAVARFADENGHGARPSITTIAAIIRKSERAAKKDIAALQKLGLVLPGDKRIVMHIRPDRRPAVYDLAMPRGEPQDTPSGKSGVNHRTERGEPQGPSGVNHRTPEEISNRSRSRARANGASAARLPSDRTVTEALADARVGQWLEDPQPLGVVLETPRAKNPDPPLDPEAERARQLAALEKIISGGTT